MQKIIKMMDIGEYQNALRIIEDEKTAQLNPTQAELRVYQSLLLGLTGDLDGALTSADIARQLAHEIGNVGLEIAADYCKSDALLKLRQYDDLEKLFTNANQTIDQSDIATEKGKIWVLKLQRIFGIFQFNVGNLTTSKKVFREVYDETKTLPDRLLEAQLLGNLAVVEYYLGEIDQSLENHLQAIELMTELGQSNNYTIGGLYNNVGLLYFSKNKPEKALEFFERSLAIMKPIGNQQFTCLIYHNMVRTFILMDNTERAEERLEDIGHMLEEKDDPYVSTAYKLTKGLVLKNLPRFRAKAEAQQLFEEISEAEIIDYQLTQQAMVQYAELLLLELDKFGTIEIIDEVLGLLDGLKVIAEEHNAKSVLAETLLIQSKMVLLEGELGRAQDLLREAISIAEEKGLTTLAAAISTELDKLIEQEALWRRLTDEDLPMKKRLEYLEISQLITEIANNQLTARKIQQEEPQIILILTNTGLPIFFKRFGEVSGLELNETLISNFITAIDLFGQETLKTGTSLERIQFKDQMLLLRPVDSIVFLYSFKGQSYTAEKKLEHFIDIIQRSDHLKRDVVDYRFSISENTVQRVDEIAAEIFLQNEVRSTL